MHVLIVTATALEIQPLLEFLKVEAPLGEGEVVSVQVGELEISFLVVGVGMMTTAFHLGKHFANHSYDGIIHAGIAGAFDRTFKIGELVVVNRQQYGDLGASSPKGLEDIFDLKLAHKDLFPFKSGKIYNNKTSLTTESTIKKVRAISVNDVSGTNKQIERIANKYNPQIEVMEGIAVHYACKQFNQQYVELRTISNYVEVRDKSKWNIPLAVKNLNDYIIQYLLRM